MEWIDVNIELPIINNNYIKQWKFESCSELIQINYIEYNINQRTIGKLNKNNEWIDHYTNRVINNVTHWYYLLFPIRKTKYEMKKVIMYEAIRLLTLNNKTTIEEIKNSLRSKSYNVLTNEVINAMEYYSNEGLFISIGDSEYLQQNKQLNKMKDLREIKKSTKTALIELLSNRIGKLLTIKFKKIDGTIKLVNGQYTGHIDKLGYHQFMSQKKEYNLFDPKNLLEVRVDKIIYQLKK